ncbi:hypothetical protein QBC42DRAFT_259555 [Cladorrhinum samala]|uniref:Secreted peptide n=1 Tax=Cladorrhinum samala TaxID=585594 RepID=A0AAV9I074_9PEZI|nr:hypothetical protein QBC42DRAFT_259555 [Cladorrhinum samala]
MCMSFMTVMAKHYLWLLFVILFSFAGILRIAGNKHFFLVAGKERGQTLNQREERKDNVFFIFLPFVWFFFFFLCCSFVYLPRLSFT